MNNTPEEKKYSNISSGDGFFDAPEEVHGYDATPDSGVHDFSSLDPEQRAKLEEEWKTELAKVEDEIMTLRQVLSVKVKQSQDLKRKLGITAWKEFRDDMGQGIKNIQESTAQSLPGLFSSPAYQKTTSTFRTAGEKTTTVLGTIGASVSKKLVDVKSVGNQYKNSTAFKSFEEKMGSAYTNVKSKMSTSRSGSVNSFEESLNNMEARSPSAASPATSPVIPEEKPLV